MTLLPFLPVAEHLEKAGLVWQPEIGDEISKRADLEIVSILIDPQGYTPTELRSQYLWLPTVEQLVFQFEARQAILFHAGLELTDDKMHYKTVIQSPASHIEATGETLRVCLGVALRDLLLGKSIGKTIH